MLKKIMFLTCLIPLSALASSTKEQIWSSIKISSKVSEQFGIAGEYINRLSHDNGKFTTRSNRLGFYYKFISGGQYTFLLENRRGSSATSNELRLINQYGYSWNLEKIKLAARGRWELRDFSDAGEFSHRLRARIKVDGTAYKFFGITPFTAIEYFNTINEISNRPAASTELRGYLGGSFNALGGKVSIAYFRRTTVDPAFKGSEKSETNYNILDLAASWSFK